MCILSPISNPSRFASSDSGIFETKVMISTSRLTTFKTPPCLIPGQLFSFINFTGTSKVTVVLSPTLRKSMCKTLSFTG